MENNLGELYGALAAARLEFGALTKTKRANMGTYTYSYADLADVIEATAAAMAKQGLVLIQEPEVVTQDGRNMVIIHGCIAHKSGGVHQLRSLPMPVAGNDAQKIGSAISYGRRYQIAAALNLAADDDDGKEATSQSKAKGETPPADDPEAQGSPPHQRFWGQGQSAFGLDWNNGARAWALEKWSERHTPGNVRTSSTEFSDDEKDMIADSLKANLSALQKAWRKHKLSKQNTGETEKVAA